MNWTPTHQPGGVYCSPGCGNLCKYEHYLDKKERAEQLAALLGEGEWLPHVWENFGWHAEVVHADRRTRVVIPHPGNLLGYNAYWSSTPGAPYITHRGNGKTVKDALIALEKSLEKAEESAVREAQVLRESVRNVGQAILNVMAEANHGKAR